MDLLIFALGAMIGVLAGGALVVRHFRAAIAGDIGHLYSGRSASIPVAGITELTD